MRHLAVALSCALLLGCAAPAGAQPGPASAPPPPPPPVHALRATGAIAVDGVLDEPVWSAAEPASAFRQQTPDQGAPTRQRTEVRVVYDDAALYVGARLYDTAPDSIVARLTRRDASVTSDAFYVALDPLHDRRSGYYFGITAAGTQVDGVLYNDEWNDSSWDGVWDARVRRDSLGWTAEIRIPFSQVRFRGGDEMTWGVNFRRFTSRANEQDLLVFTPHGQSGYVSRFPELVGLRGVRAHRAIELVPYVTFKQQALVHDPADPFRGGSGASGAVGGDLRTSVGPKLTLNATFNPDFGQVEIDPAVVNLSDVETYFQEKRPFFTENSSIFIFGQNGARDYWGFNWSDPKFFYTRRVGRAPQGSPPGADWADLPLGTSILGAAKLTGQPAPGWNVGAVQALTAREDARLSTGGVESHAAVEPMAYYGVLRGLHEMDDRRAGVGLMTLTTARSFTWAEGLRPQLDAGSNVAGVDGWWFLDRKRDWVVSGYAAGSNVTGGAERITALQRDPVHYYQRPDARDLGVDSAATSLTGYAARVWLNHQNGAFLSNSAFGLLSPGFEANDLGYEARANLINGHVGAGWKWEQPRGWRQYADVILAVARSWDFEGVTTLQMYWGGVDLTFRDNASTSINYYVIPQVMNDRATRGGPLMVRRRTDAGSLHLESNSNAKVWLYLDVNPSRTADGSWEMNASPGVAWKPQPNLSFEFNPSFDRTYVDAQYVATVSDPARTATFGNDYVFARLVQNTLSASLRMDLALSTGLSLQAYVQPLVATGRYQDLRSLAAPRTDQFAAFDPAVLPQGQSLQPDFATRSLRGNVVLRWEYRPGSALYLVWTQTRETDSGDAQFRPGPSLSELARTPANDVFLVKLSHHFEL